jgi:hypothetical protein
VCVCLRMYKWSFISASSFTFILPFFALFSVLRLTCTSYINKLSLSPGFHFPYPVGSPGRISKGGKRIRLWYSFSCPLMKDPWGWGCSSVVKHLSSLHKTLGSIISTAKKNDLYSYSNDIYMTFWVNWFLCICVFSSPASPSYFKCDNPQYYLGEKIKIQT